MGQSVWCLQCTDSSLRRCESSLGLIVSSLGRRAQLLGRVCFAPRGATTHTDILGPK